jgi:hypothetical protein
MAKEELSPASRQYVDDILATAAGLARIADPTPQEQRAKAAVDRLIATLRHQGIIMPDRFLCRVEDDAAGTTNTFVVTAPTPELAGLLAFAADGGFYMAKPAAETPLSFDDLVELAKCHTTVSPL